MENMKQWLTHLIGNKLRFGDDYAERAMIRLMDAIPLDDPDRRRLETAWPKGHAATTKRSVTR
jgi:hypothetical protein